MVQAQKFYAVFTVAVALGIALNYAGFEQQADESATGPGSFVRSTQMGIRF